MRRTIAVGIVCFLFVQAWGAAEKPTAKELLDKFAIQRENYKSFTSKTEKTVHYELKAGPKFPSPSTNHNSTTMMDFRLDLNSRRANIRNAKFGNINPLSPNVPKDNPQYTSLLYLDNKIDRWYGRSDMTSDKGRMTLSKKPYPDANLTATQYLSRAYSGNSALGYFFGDDEPFDEVLRRASNITVRQQMERVGDSNCYIIDAVTGRGRYTVWIDSEHGYNVAKAKVLRNEGDAYSSLKSIPKGDSYYVSLENVKFQNFDGIWAPVEADIEHTNKTSKYNSHEIDHYKVLEYKFNPDHDALGSFNSDDIQNGATVRMSDENGKIVLDKDQKPFIWRDGEVIDKDGKVVLDCKNKAAKPDISKGSQE